MQNNRPDDRDMISATTIKMGSNWLAVFTYPDCIRTFDGTNWNISEAKSPTKEATDRASDNNN